MANNWRDVNERNRMMTNTTFDGGVQGHIRLGQATSEFNIRPIPEYDESKSHLTKIQHK